MNFACPCCRLPTLPRRGGFDICLVCWWEDDGQDDADADDPNGGPNGDLTLTEARATWASQGWCGHPVDGPPDWTQALRDLRAAGMAVRDGAPFDPAAFAAAIRAAVASLSEER